MKVIVTSEKEMASVNMWNYFLEHFDFKEQGEYDGHPTYKYRDFLLVMSKRGIIYIDDLDDYFDPEYYIFASPHESERGVPCLTVHPIGNFGKAEMGGRERELGTCHSLLMKGLALELKTRNLTQFPVSLEVTHHGPTSLRKPVVFVEIGSSKSEWCNEKAIETVCSAILEGKIAKGKSAIGFGGPHYAPNFTRRELDTELAFGHMCPKYHLDNLDAELTEQMIEKTVPRPEIAILDWKGMKREQREKVVKILEEMGVEWEKI